MARTRRNGRSVSALWLVLSAGACAPFAARPASAQVAQPAPTFTGHDFGGVRFHQAVVPEKVSFRAVRVWSWEDGSCRRLLLDGDVHATIAGYSFAAKRASVWMEKAEGEKETWQVYAYFESLGSAADPAGTVSMASDHLPVKAIVQLEAPVQLQADMLINESPLTRNDPPPPLQHLADATAALIKSLRRASGVPEPEPPPAPIPFLSRKSQFVRQPRPELPQPGPIGNAAAPPPAPLVGPPRPGTEANEPGPQQQPEQPPPQPQANGPQPTKPRPAGERPPEQSSERQPIFAKDGVITLGAGDASLVSGAEENSIILTGGVTIQYWKRASAGKPEQTYQMTAQRAVVFTDPGRLENMLRMSSDTVRGIFLEGDVQASNNTFTLRGPQVYYDLTHDRAVAPDAVFWTYDAKRRLPLYVRAKSIRQVALNEFEADHAEITNSAFFDPELAIGASTVTVTKEDREVEEEPDLDGPPRPRKTVETRTIVDARNVTLDAMGVPVFYWPWYSGDPESFPVKDFRFENRAGSGGAVRATLNAYALLGLKHPGDFTADLLTDFYFERGAGLGTHLAWDTPTSKGSLFGYTLPSDRGWDIVKPGAHINHDGEFRGMATGEEWWKFDDHWTLRAEFSSISDPTFIENFYPIDAEQRREYTNRLEADRHEDNTYFSIQAKHNVQDFLNNEYLLESQGYAVNKMPEAYYSRLADDLLPDTAPGLLSYSSEYRAGRMSLSMDDVTAAKHGFIFDTSAQRAFGINANQSLSELLRSRGLFESPVDRFDTRHEVSAQLNVGPVHVMPFAVGRVTFWDDQFHAFSPDQDSETRVWTAAGVRLSTTIQHVYESVDSSFLDLHRVRHIIEPNATFWYAGTNVESSALPTYDQDVEALANGGQTKVGITQTLQTQRGGPGQWHNVDLLTLDTSVMLASKNTPRTSPIGRFLDFRPELSNPGNFFVNEGVLRLTDAASLTGANIYDLDLHQQAASDIGILLRQAPALTTLVDLRYVNAENSTYINMGASYELTDKYSLLVGVTYNASSGGFQSTAFELHRKFASTVLGLSVAYNDITGQSSFGIVFQPYGASGATRIMGLGGSDPLGATVLSR